MVPAALVFGEFPILRTFLGPIIPRESLGERAEVEQKARRIMSKHLAQLCIKRALKQNIPAVEKEAYHLSNKVFIWREKIVGSRIGEWLSSYTVFSFVTESQIVLVRKEEDSNSERYNITQIKPYIQRETIAAQFIHTLYYGLLPYCIHITEIL